MCYCCCWFCLRSNGHLRVCLCMLPVSSAFVSVSLGPPSPIHAQHGINKPASGHVMA